MYCKECGSLIADDAKFCSNCGEKIIYEQSTELSRIKNTSSSKLVCQKCNCLLILTHNLFGAEIFICPNCNTDIKNGICPVCRRKIPTFRDTSCNACGFSWKNIVIVPTSTSSIRREVESYQGLETKHNSNTIEPVKSFSEPKEPELKCPRCGSTHITANKKGYSAGKAIAGVVLAGGIGLLGGFLGSGKVKITCLRCGHAWNAG